MDEKGSVSRSAHTWAARFWAARLDCESSRFTTRRPSMGGAESGMGVSSGMSGSWPGMEGGSRAEGLVAPVPGEPVRAAEGVAG